jgi:hypothetical protein
MLHPPPQTMPQRGRTGWAWAGRVDELYGQARREMSRGANPVVPRTLQELVQAFRKDSLVFSGKRSLSWIGCRLCTIPRNDGRLRRNSPTFCHLSPVRMR